MVEKASCDEAFIDVTRQVEIKFKLAKDQPIDYDNKWNDSLFMGFAKGEGGFFPDSEDDCKLWLANQMAF
jgi:nucleotidyltransferase/DNA polymerase involved in DNA repair